MIIKIKHQHIYENERMKVENPNYEIWDIEIDDEEVKKVIEEIRKPYLCVQHMMPPDLEIKEVRL